MTQIDHDPALKYARAVEPPPRRRITVYGVAVVLCAVPTIYLVVRLLIALIRAAAP